MRHETRDGMSVLALLRADARNWWAHDTEAKVRKAIRSDVRFLREAREGGAFVSVGRGGTTVRFTTRRADGRTRSTVAAECHPGKGLAARRLFPWVDTTTVPDAQIVHVALRLPMLVPDVRATLPDRFGSHTEGYRGLDTVPFLTYRELAEPFGATFGNLDKIPECARRLAGGGS